MNHCTAPWNYFKLIMSTQEEWEIALGPDGALEAFLESREQGPMRYIAELEQVGLITIQRRGQGRPNLYTIHLKASFWKKLR